MEKNTIQATEKKESQKIIFSNKKEYKLDIFNITNNKANNKSDNSYALIKDLPLQITHAEKSKDKVNLKYRKFTTNKNHPWKIKEISLDELNSYNFIINLIKSSLDSSISNSENLKINFHINKKDKIICSVSSKEDWELNFNENKKKDDFLKTIISEHKTIKIEYELHDLNKNFNDIANKLDLQNKIIENLFESLKNNEKIKKEITENLKIKIAKEDSNDKINNEIFKSRYAKILQDYTEKVYETLLNNIRNFQSLQDDLKKINLDQELDFNKFDDFAENQNFHNENFNLNDNNFLENNEFDQELNSYANQGISYRSSYNLDNKDEMISKLIIETRNSLFNK